MDDNCGYILGSKFNEERKEDKYNYYKLTNLTEIHRGFAFKDGLNVLQEPFNTDIKCAGGGFYFCHGKDMGNWFFYTTKKKINEMGVEFQFCDEPMCYIRKVIIPDDVRVVVGTKKIKTNKFILGEKILIYNYILDLYKCRFDQCSYLKILVSVVPIGNDFFNISQLWDDMLERHDYSFFNAALFKMPEPLLTKSRLEKLITMYRSSLYYKKYSPQFTTNVEEFIRSRMSAKKKTNFSKKSKKIVKRKVELPFSSTIPIFN